MKFTMLFQHSFYSHQHAHKLYFTKVLNQENLVIIFQAVYHQTNALYFNKYLLLLSNNQNPKLKNHIV